MIIRTDKQLDEWDYRVLDIMKRKASCMPKGNDPVKFKQGVRDMFIQVWNKRCGCNVTSLQYLAERWLGLNDTYQWFTSSKLIDTLAPSCLFPNDPTFWVFGDKDNFWDKTFSAIVSILMLTEYTKFPGYKEWDDDRIDMLAPNNN